MCLDVSFSYVLCISQNIYNLKQMFIIDEHLFLKYQRLFIISVIRQLPADISTYRLFPVLQVEAQFDGSIIFLTTGEFQIL